MVGGARPGEATVRASVEGSSGQGSGENAGVVGATEVIKPRAGAGAKNPKVSLPQGKKKKSSASGTENRKKSHTGNDPFSSPGGDTSRGGRESRRDIFLGSELEI